jgi:hypothetical protein
LGYWNHILTVVGWIILLPLLLCEKLFYVLPLEDPENVDKRRAEVGLQPIADYVIEWQIKWDVEQYKKDLAKIEAKEKANQK